MENNREIWIWGAGKIGRGFIGDLFNRAGYRIGFIDASRELTEGLAARGKYTVLNLPGTGEREEVNVSGFSTLHTDEKENIRSKLCTCSLMAVAVFPTAFEQTARDLVPVIEERAEKLRDATLDIFLCANTFHPAGKLEELLAGMLSENGKNYLEEKVGLVDTLIMRMAIEPAKEMKDLDPYVVVTNGYPEMPADRTAFKGEPPAVEGILYTENILAEETRKMYTYNMLHAVYAYLGSSKNYAYVIDCTRDQEVQEIAVNTLEEVSRTLQKEFGFTPEDMEKWNKRVLKNMANPILMDRLDRVGADPVRKLKRDDRLTGPALMCRKNGMLPYFLAKAIAYGFLFENEQDEASRQVRQYVAEQGIKEAVRKYCQLDREVELIQLIAEHYRKAVEGKGIGEDFAKVSLIKKAFELGFYHEKKFRGCAQCTLSAIFELTGKTDKNLYQAASGFSGGMAITGDGSCGGYTGGVLFMGSYVGRRLDYLDTGDKEAQYKSYEMAQKLHDRYMETYGTVTCADIHRQIFGRVFCLRTKPVRDEFEEAGGHRDKCTTVIGTACTWIAELLLEEGFIEPSEI